jgi:DNA-binding transcriptional LysR family regulator
MMLTEAGDVLLARASSVLRDLEAARADVMTETGTVRGKVVLGTPPTAGDAISARLVKRFLSAHPDVSIRIVPAFSGYLLDWLQRGEIDLAIMYEPDAKQNLAIEPLISEVLCAVAPPATRLPKRRLPLVQVLTQRLVLPGPQHGLRKLVERAAAKVDCKLNIVVEADSLQTLRDLVEMNLGWTILPLASVHREITDGRLKAAQIEAPELSRTLVIAEALGRPSARATRLLREALAAEVRDMVRRKVWSGIILK